MACPSLDDEIIVAGTDEVATDDVATDDAATEGEPEPGIDVEIPAKIYFMGESLDFSGGGACSNDDLNDVTGSLALELQDAGWLGIRWVNQQSWPEDFVETTFFANALDKLYGDGATLSVYAGHGNVGLWQWGQPSGAGACVLPLTSGMRLGTLAGDASTTVMSLTSCTGRADQLWPTLGQPNRVRQILAYHNSPIIWGNQPRDFFRATANGMSNRVAWLTIMANKPGIGHNSPSLITIASSPASALELHESASLASLAGLSAPAEDAQEFVFSYLDYGCGPCGCPAAPVGEAGWRDLAAASHSVGTAAASFPSTSPTVMLARPQRASGELLEHVSGVLDLAEVEWDPAIPAWIEGSLALPEQTSILRLASAAIYLTYNPREDDLTLIFDRSVGETTLDEAGARNWFQGLIEDAEAAGLIGALEHEIERVGTIRLQTGSGLESMPSPRTEGWRFEVTRTHGGLPVLGAGLAAVIQSDGRLGSLRISDLIVEHQEWAVATPTPELVAQRWNEALAAHHRPPQAVQFERMRWAFALAPEQSASIATPRLVIDYVLGYDAGEARVPSRQNVVALAVQADKPAALLSP